MLEVTETEIKKRLAFDNPWWESGSVDDRYRTWPKRAYFDGFLKLVKQTEINRAVVLMGPRRVGKTVMLTQVIQARIEEGIDPKKICYVSVDTPTYTGIGLEQLLRWFMEIHGHDRRDDLFLFFDEIQYHPDWERHLKSLVDSFPEFRFVVSGSAAAALKMKSLESGAGRFTDFLLPPLNFMEFLRFQDQEALSSNLTTAEPSKRDIELLNKHLIEYMNYGGFPESVMEEAIRADMSRFIANDVVDKVLLRDLPSLYGISDTQELKRLFTVLAYNSGQELGYEGLSKASGVAKNTLRKYLDYLETAFLIQRLYRVDNNARRFKRVTHFKVYLTNPCIRTALFGPISADDSGIGPLVETAVISQLAQSHASALCFYARWSKGEVDLVMLNPREGWRPSAREIKWSDRFVARPGEELGSLIQFCKQNEIKDAFVYSRSAMGKLDIDDLQILCAPASYAAYLFANQAVTVAERGVSPDLDKSLFRQAAAFKTRPLASG